MDIFGLVWLPDIIVWFIIIAVGLYIYGIWPYSTLQSYGYKGPKPKPFLGNVDLMYQYGFLGKWELVGKSLYGKVFSMYEGRQPVIVVFDTDVLKQIMVKQFSNFEDRRKFPLRGEVMQHSLVDINGDDWRRIRNLTTPFFTSGKLRKNIELLKGCCENLIKQCDKHVARNQALEMEKLTGAFTIEAICLTAFGLQINSQEHPDHQLISAMKKMVLAFDDQFTSSMSIMFAFPIIVTLLEKLGFDMWPKGSIDTLRELAKIAIDERKKSHEERPDFVHALIKAHDEDIKHQSQNEILGGHSTKGMSEIEMIAQVAVFALAGYDTSSTALSFLMFCLANNPDCQDKVLREIDDIIGNDEITYENLKKMQYLDMCLEESLRLYSPLLRIERVCVKDTTINGFYFPKDTLLDIPIYGLHHDPELWNNPEKFDPERFSPTNRTKIDPYSYLPFGLGPRNCVGMRLAKIEVKMALIYMIRNYKVTVSKKTPIPLQMKNSFAARVQGGLHLNFEKRQK